MPETPPTLFVKLVVCDGAGHLLLQRRRKDDRYQGFWELPGGRVRAGETLLAAARRELREETGLALLRLLAQTGTEELDRFGGVARVVNPLITVETIIPLPTEAETDAASDARDLADEAAGSPVGTLVLGHYFACLASGDAERTIEADAHRWITAEALRDQFLERPEVDLSTLDRLALRQAFDAVRRCLADPA